MSIGRALGELPLCCGSAYENLLSDSGRHHNLKDMLDAIEYEISLYLEDQDGCMSEKEYRQCMAWKRKWTKPVTPGESTTS